MISLGKTLTHQRSIKKKYQKIFTKRLYVRSPVHFISVFKFVVLCRLSRCFSNSFEFRFYIHPIKCRSVPVAVVITHPSVDCLVPLESLHPPSTDAEKQQQTNKFYSGTITAVTGVALFEPVQNSLTHHYISLTKNQSS